VGSFINKVQFLWGMKFLVFFDPHGLGSKHTLHFVGFLRKILKITPPLNFFHTNCLIDHEALSELAMNSSLSSCI